MTDKEKLAMLVGYIKGVIGSNSYVASLYVEPMKEFLKNIEK